MEKTIFKTLAYLFIGALFMFCLSTVIYSVPVEEAYVHYEQEPVIHKINFYKANKNQFNSIFIGTSRIYRQVAPALFDSLNDGITASYNAAYDNLAPYRTFDYMKYLEIDNSCKYVFIELTPPSTIGDNYNTNPALFSINYNQYFSLWDFSLNSNYPFQYKVYYLLRYSQTFFYKYLGFGLKKYIGLIINNDEPTLDSLPYSLAETRGFQPYPEGPALHKNERLAERRKNFLKDADQKIENIIRQSSPVIPEQAPIRDAYIDDLLQLEKDLFDKNIEVFYIISPRRKPHDLIYIATVRSFLKGQVIDLSSPKLYPSFYLEKYSFDEKHLTKEGSEIFTEELSRTFMKLKKKDTLFVLTP